MNRVPLARLARAGLLLMGTAAFVGCADSGLPPGPADGINAALGGGGKPTSGPSVTATDPSYGHEGDVSKQVTITGSGFAPGAQAAWERGGIVDDKIQVLSTQYVSSSQLIATITIAPDAAISLYDVSVSNPDKKKGIGYALFEVTQAIVVDGIDLLHDVNDNGDMTGYGTGGSFFNPASGLELLNPSGIGWGIDQTGTAIVGGGPRLWNKVGGVWQATLLPTDPSATGGRASSLSADASGQVLLIGGLESVATGNEPRLWVWQAATNDWGRIVLPSGQTTTKHGATTNIGDVLAVSDNGVAVGWIGGSSIQAVVWESNGSGYSMTTLAGGRAMGINRAGTIIVGGTGAGAVYWQRLSGGGWSPAITLPGGCGIAYAVDDFGRIVANSCPNGNRTTPAVFVIPYSATTMIPLGGQGPNFSGTVLGMSPSGNYVVGQLVSGSTSKGVYWKIF